MTGTAAGRVPAQRGADAAGRAGPGRTETSQTLDRGLRVLRVLADGERGLTVGELAERLAVNRTVVYRLLATLELHRLVRRGQDGRYRLGLGLLGLAAGTQPLLAEAAGPLLRGIADRTGSTAYLAVADGGDGLVVAAAEPRSGELHVALRAGARRPLGSGAVGAALRAGRGWVQSEEAPGVVGIAAPVQGGAGVEAAVAIIGFDTDEGPEQHGDLVTAAAEVLGAALR